MKTYQNLNNKYLKLINENFPEINYKSYKLIKKWWSNNIIILDNKIIFRFPKEDYIKNNFIKEVKILNFLNKYITGISIPKYNYISTNNDFWWYNLIKWTEFKKHNINKTNYKKITMQIWLFLTQLHSIDINKFKYLINLDINKHYSFETWYIEYIINKFKEIENNFSKEDFNKIIKFIINSQNIKISKYCLTHYDLQWKNIIISDNKNKINWIIDFSDIAIYDPAIDFIRFLWLSKKYLNEILNNYKLNNWNIIKRAYYYRIKKIIFAFPDYFYKYKKLSPITKIINQI